MSSIITTLLVDDHTLVRQGFRTLLDLAGGIKVIGEAPNGREAVATAKLHRPDVVVMDFAMPLLNGLESTKQILSALPSTKVIILSCYDDDAHINSVMAAGAAGYLFKQSSAELLVQAIREVHAGNKFFTPRLVKYPAYGSPPVLRQDKPKPLTSREIEVIQLIAESHGNKQVAAALGISVKTAGKHRQNIMNKLNLHDTAGLTRYAIAQGITENSNRMVAMM